MSAVQVNRVVGMRKAATALALLATATVAFADDHVLTIGQAGSPTLKALIGSRQIWNGRDVMASQLKEPSAARQAQATLKSAGFVAVDLAEAEPNEADSKLVAAAMEAGVPIVVENADAGRMASLFGIGIGNSLAIVEFNPRTNKGRINLADPMQMEEVPGYEALPALYANFGDRVRFAQEILSKKASTRDTIVTAGICGSLPLSTCREFEVAAPVMNFCPYRYSTRTYTCEYGIASIDPNMDVAIYAARDSQDGQVKRFLVARATGGWSIAASLAGGAPPSRNDNWERFPFFSRYRMSMIPYVGSTVALPSGWRMLASAPTNANSATSVDSTTGWSVSGTAGCGVDTSGPNCSASITAGYSATTTQSVTLQDWSTQNNSSSIGTDFSYFMSKATLGSNPVSFTLTELMNLGTFNEKMYKQYTGWMLRPLCER